MGIFDENPDLHYPVIYYLHGWMGNQNSGGNMLYFLQSMINNGTIEPAMMVCADNYCEPFGGSIYMNSILWGDYEDYNVVDLIAWVDSSFRTIPERDARGMIGQSMGGYAAFRLGLLYPDVFCAFAAHGAEVNFALFMDDVQEEILNENQGPPYAYNFVGGGNFTKWMFLASGGLSPNLNTPQTYIDPAIVEFPFDENGEPIDSILQKHAAYDVIPLLHAFPTAQTMGIFFSCGADDEWRIFEANEALQDTLDEIGMPYHFYPHDGDHNMPILFKEKAFIFLDSLMMEPVIVPTGVPGRLAGDSKLNISVSPNPATTMVYVTFTIEEPASVQIEFLNYTGEFIFTVPMPVISPGTQQQSVSLAGLNAGVYICRVRSGGHTEERKIIKIR